MVYFSTMRKNVKKQCVMNEFARNLPSSSHAVKRFATGKDGI